LVELTGEILYRQVWSMGKVALVRYGVCYSLAKDAVATLLKQLRCKTKEVIHIDIAQRLQVELEVLVELVLQTKSLYLKRGTLFYVYTKISHD
jgi:hypothetical protein